MPRSCKFSSSCFHVILWLAFRTPWSSCKICRNMYQLEFIDVPSVEQGRCRLLWRWVFYKQEAHWIIIHPSPPTRPRANTCPRSLSGQLSPAGPDDMHPTLNTKAATLGRPPASQSLTMSCIMKSERFTPQGHTQKKMTPLLIGPPRHKTVPTLRISVYLFVKQSLAYHGG